MTPCDSPRCRQPSDVIYLHAHLCRGHWNEIADADAGSNDEDKLLARYGLQRIGGEVERTGYRDNTEVVNGCGRT